MRHPARGLLLICALLLAGCGGDVSWCFSSGAGAVSAGANVDDCPPHPEEDDKPPAR